MRELAAIASMSRFQLTRQFQQAFGLPLHAYHLHVRLEEAKRRSPIRRVNRVRRSRPGFCGSKPFPQALQAMVRSDAKRVAAVLQPNLTVRPVQKSPHTDSRPGVLVRRVRSRLGVHMDARAAMTDVILKRLEQPDEAHTFELGRFELVTLGGMTIGRATYLPGWRWSRHVGASSVRHTARFEHIGLVSRGTLRPRCTTARSTTWSPARSFTSRPSRTIAGL